MKLFYLFLLSLSLFGADTIENSIKINREISGGDFGTFAILQHAPNNGYLYFKVQNSSLSCKPYGVVSVHELLYDVNASQRCRESLLSYFRSHPKDYYFSDYHLHLQQMYHIEYKPDSCIIYSRGSVSYARELLRAGLARVKRGFKDPLYRKKYRAEEEGAKFLKRGIYQSKVLRDCGGDFRK